MLRGDIAERQAFTLFEILCLGRVCSGRVSRLIAVWLGRGLIVALSE